MGAYRAARGLCVPGPLVIRILSEQYMGTWMNERSINHEQMRERMHGWMDGWMHVWVSAVVMVQGAGLACRVSLVFSSSSSGRSRWTTMPSSWSSSPSGVIMKFSSVTCTIPSAPVWLLYRRRPDLLKLQALRQGFQDGEPFQDGAFIWALWDALIKLWNRHNEVWVAAAERAVALVQVRGRLHSQVQT